MAISFSNQNIEFKLKNKAHLKKWIAEVANKEKRVIGNINYIFTNDEDLLKTNIQFLKHNTYTDIITFDYSESKKISADIFISVERVKDNSEKLKTHYDEELRRVIIHGVLHLCGYKDKSKVDSAKMRKQENKALSMYNKNLK